MTIHDVLVIGGSYAGLAAALQLGRARRDVLVLDAGERRNRFASHAHGFLGQDGVPPGEIAARGRADVARYPTVALRDARALSVRAEPDGTFVVATEGDTHRAHRVVLATGVVDTLPAVPGLTDLWGDSAFVCPYCHGYELDEGHLGVLASGPLSLHQAVLVAEWAGADGVTYFTNGAHDPDDAERAELAARNVRVEPRLVRHVGGASPRVVVTLDGGAEVTVAGLFLAPISRPSELALALGCDLTETPFGAVVAADPMTRETSVPGVYACGDAANPMAAIALAVADGVRAGAGVHRSLVMGPAARPRAARSAVSGAR